jgi:endonuclease YncB( thermonuclease family)
VEKLLANLSTRHFSSRDEQEAAGYAETLVAAPGRKALNFWLVREGLAWVHPQFCRRTDICDRLRELERTARESKAGLWADGEMGGAVGVEE